MPDRRNSSVLSILTALSVAIAPLAILRPAQAQSPVSPALESPTLLAQQADRPLVERPSYVNTCRNSGATALPVYTSSALTDTVGTLQPYTRITLTGVLGTGTAQVSGPISGWVRSATLLTDCNAGPTPDPDPSERGACYQVVPSALTVRNAPYGDAIANALRNQRVYATVPPNRRTTADGRIWLQVFYNQTSNLGWVAQTGTGGAGANLANCP